MEDVVDISNHLVMGNQTVRIRPDRVHPAAAPVAPVVTPQLELRAEEVAVGRAAGGAASSVYLEQGQRLMASVLAAEVDEEEDEGLDTLLHQP
jgi:hypothetical protein